MPTTKAQHGPPHGPLRRRYHRRQHGLESSFDSTPLPGVDRTKLAPALEAVEQQVISEVPTAFLNIERKAISTAFHFRTPPQLEEPLRKSLARLPGGLRIREGRMVGEVFPDVNGGKDRPLTALTGYFKAHSIVVMGDDLTDVAMFKAAAAEREGPRRLNAQPTGTPRNA